MTAHPHGLEEVAKHKFSDVPVSSHPTFDLVYEKLEMWMNRFPRAVDSTLINDLLLFYLLAPKEFLDHRNPTHLFRMILSIHLMQKKLFGQKLHRRIRGT